MPLIGIAIGRPIGRTIGAGPGFAAAGLIVALGLYMLVSPDTNVDGDRFLSMTQRGVGGAAALGVSISLDELAMRVSAGLLHISLVPLVLVIAIQTFIVPQARRAPGHPAWRT